MTTFLRLSRGRDPSEQSEKSSYLSCHRWPGRGPNVMGGGDCNLKLHVDELFITLAYSNTSKRTIAVTDVAQNCLGSHRGYPMHRFG